MSQQVLTFPVQGSVLRRLVPGLGAMIDYESMSVTPCTLDVIGSCMKRLSRYGVHVGASTRSPTCSILVHSLYVGELAKRLSIPYMDDVCLPSGHLVAGMVGATHDVGKIFGGSIPAMVPSDVRTGMDVYQEACRQSVLLTLGYPTFVHEALSSLVELCSLLVMRGEMIAIGADEAFHHDSWTQRCSDLAMECPVVDGMKMSELKGMADIVFFDFEKKGGNGFDMPKLLSRWKSLAAPEIMIAAYRDASDDFVFSSWDRSDVPIGAWGGSDHSVFHGWLRSVSMDVPFVLHDLFDAKGNGMARTWFVSADGTPSIHQSYPRSSR